jgi:hypothetical protein
VIVFSGAKTDAFGSNALRVGAWNGKLEGLAEFNEGRFQVVELLS